MAKLKVKALAAGKRLKTQKPATVSCMDLPPKFSFSFIQVGRYCLSQCDRDDKAALADKLHRLSKLTWSQIFNAGRHSLGFEKIEVPKLSSPARFKEFQQIAFRFNGMKSLVGVLEHDTFYILWLDHNFTLYDHG